jgi:DNA-damage-inducible protein J
MATNPRVQARIDGEIEEEAAAALASMGLTISDAVRLMLTRVAQEHALPFDPLIPNAETFETMQEARHGKLKSFDTLDDLMADIDAED